MPSSPCSQWPLPSSHWLANMTKHFLTYLNCFAEFRLTIRLRFFWRALLRAAGLPYTLQFDKQMPLSFLYLAKIAKLVPFRACSLINLWSTYARMSSLLAPGGACKVEEMLEAPDVELDARVERLLSDGVSGGWCWGWGAWFLTKRKCWLSRVWRRRSSGVSSWCPLPLDAAEGGLICSLFCVFCGVGGVGACSHRPDFQSCAKKDW